MIWLTYRLDLPPSVNAYWRRTRRGICLTDAAVAFRASVIDAVNRQGRPHIPLAHTLEMDVGVYWRRRADAAVRDLDNLVKGLQDALEHAGVIANDNRIKRLIVAERGVCAPGSVIVSLKQLAWKQGEWVYANPSVD